jgi:preprotein translocase subunit SecF
MSTQNTSHQNEKTNIVRTSNGVNLERFKYQFFILPIAAAVLAIAAIVVWGLKPGIDLRGGSLLEVAYPDGRPELSELQEKMDTLGLGEVRIQAAGENEYMLRQRALTQKEKESVDYVVQSFGTAEEVQFNSVGPSVGEELIRKAWWAISLVSLSIILFIAFAFRGVSKPVSSWKYGVVAIITLLHDILIPTGYFAYLGHSRGAEVGVLFIVALLTILGISINDTIVVFDRIRENLTFNEKKGRHEEFNTVVWKSIKQTLARSINTSVTVIIMLVALFIMGPESTKDFALTLTIGMIAGTYSSIFLASPMLVIIAEYERKRKKATA